MSAPNFRPCPFCGTVGEMKIHVNKGIWDGRAYCEPVSVEVHHRCPPVPGQATFKITRIGHDETSAIAAWNDRATPPLANAVTAISPSEQVSSGSALPRMSRDIAHDMVRTGRPAADLIREAFAMGADSRAIAGGSTTDAALIKASMPENDKLLAMAVLAGFEGQCAAGEPDWFEATETQVIAFAQELFRLRPDRAAQSTKPGDSNA